MNEWRPIETAPKDGTKIYLFPQLQTAWWEFGDNEWMYGAVALNDNRQILEQFKWDAERPPMWFCLYVEDEPTHWQPLPAPPKDASPSERALAMEGRE